MGLTFFDKAWEAHVVTTLPGGVTLLAVDRHLIHDLVAGPALEELAARGLPVFNSERTFATPDHGVGSEPERPVGLDPVASGLLDRMRTLTRRSGIRLFDLGEDGQGIVHVTGPELGLTLPGMLVVCGDSHTCTHGGLGALAFGIGTTEVVHVLATQTIRQKKPKQMRIVLSGDLAEGVTAKDVILHVIGRLGTKAGQGYAIEYAGSVVDALTIEARLTLCNLSVELGAKIGMIAPDERTYCYLRDRLFAPKGDLFDRAVSYWRTLQTDADAVFDEELHFHVDSVRPQVTWGTSPEDVVPLTGRVPDPSAAKNPGDRIRMEAALSYMGLEPGQRMVGIPIQQVFIGSCANGRLSDLREAAAVARHGHVAPHVRAWVVPGSKRVKDEAESEGLDQIFRDAGFEWREPSCSLCLATTNERLEPGIRSISTTNRNFVGRQGTAVRTHLSSPAVAAASALAGCIADFANDRSV